MTIIPKPSIGRIVHVHVRGQAHPGIVTAVAPGLYIQVTVFTGNGLSYLDAVPHGSDPYESDGPYWTWPERV